MCICWAVKWNEVTGLHLFNNFDVPVESVHTLSTYFFLLRSFSLHIFVYCLLLQLEFCIIAKITETFFSVSRKLCVCLYVMLLCMKITHKENEKKKVLIMKSTFRTTAICSISIWMFSWEEEEKMRIFYGSIDPKT